MDPKNKPRMFQRQLKLIETNFSVFLLDQLLGFALRVHILVPLAGLHSRICSIQTIFVRTISDP